MNITYNFYTRGDYTDHSGDEVYQSQILVGYAVATPVEDGWFVEIFQVNPYKYIGYKRRASFVIDGGCDLLQVIRKHLHAKEIHCTGAIVAKQGRTTMTFNGSIRSRKLLIVFSGVDLSYRDFVVTYRKGVFKTEIDGVEVKVRGILDFLLSVYAMWELLR